MVQQKEARLVNEWIMLNYPKALQWRRVRLGPLPLKQLSRAFKVTQRWVDLVFFWDNVLYVCEAKMKPNYGAIGQLEGYLDLIDKTPEFSFFLSYPKKGILLTTYEDPEIKRYAESKGIQYVVYAPDWVKEV